MLIDVLNRSRIQNENLGDEIKYIYPSYNIGLQFQSTTLILTIEMKYIKKKISTSTNKTVFVVVVVTMGSFCCCCW